MCWSASASIHTCKLQHTLGNGNDQHHHRRLRRQAVAGCRAASTECGQGREAEVQLLQGAEEEGVLSSGSGGSQGAPLLVAAPALLEVDERMSAERTWLGDNLLGWILLGAVGLVLCFHSVYSYILDDGDQSGAGGNTL
ncbi:hypothetical protein VPH35_016231 [Triticum aestivum]